MSEATQLPAPGDETTTYVVDISSYVFRAYHALPPLSNSKGEPTHAVSGVASMLAKFIRDRKPHGLVVAMDSKKGSFRKEAFPAYKANRPPAPPDLTQQMSRVREVVEAWGMTPLEADGFEADDVIATIVSAARKNDRKVVIVSADKDLLQLVGDDVVMYDTMRNKVFGIAETHEKFGVGPNQVRDLLALMGDSSDNVPGVKSVGQKTAAKLLQEFGDLDNIYANIESITRKALKKNLIEYRQDADTSRDLVTLRHDAPVDTDIALAPFAGADATRLRALFAELEFTRLLAQFDPESATDAAQASAKIEGSYKTVTTLEELRQVASAIREHNRFALHSVLDVEHPMKATLVGVSLGWLEGVAVYIPIDDTGASGQRSLDAPEHLDWATVEPVLRPLLENSLMAKYGDLKRERLIWARLGVDFRGGTFDPAIASYLLEPGRRGHDLDEFARLELGAELRTAQAVAGKGKNAKTWNEVEISAVSDYACERADYTFRLEQAVGPRMREGDFETLFYGLELPLADVLADMERTGIRVDVGLLGKLEQEAAKEMLRLEELCTALAGREFNVSSPRQLETILFDELELPVIKKTKTARSTDHGVLEALALHHDLPIAILEYRSVAKLKSTYLDALPSEVNQATGRIHTRYNQVVAATGRLSSSDPNLQNIPIRTEMGRCVRDAFVPAEGFELLAADYSQIELRVLAHLSEDKELVDAFSSGADVHVRTATALFDVKTEDVTRELRGRAKTVNFAVIYGQTQFALAGNLKIERKEAKRYIEAFFDRYAGVRTFMDNVVEHARETGYVTTLMGRRRSLPNIRSRNHHLRAGAERIAQNTPIQGTAADIMKLAMVRIQRELRTQALRTNMVLTVHDELVFEVPPDEKESVAALVKEHMEGAMVLSVPLPVQMGWGANWGDAH